MVTLNKGTYLTSNDLKVPDLHSNLEENLYRDTPSLDLYSQKNQFPNLEWPLYFKNFGAQFGAKYGIPKFHNPVKFRAKGKIEEISL